MCVCFYYLDTDIYIYIYIKREHEHVHIGLCVYIDTHTRLFETGTVMYNGVLTSVVASTTTVTQM